MRDPVCGKELDPKTILFTSIYENRVYSFCSLTCKKAFDEKPERYAHREPAAEYCYSCGYNKRYRGPAFYLWIGLIAVVIVVILLSLLLR